MHGAQGIGQAVAFTIHQKVFTVVGQSPPFYGCERFQGTSGADPGVRTIQMTRHFDRDITKAPTGRRTIWIPPVPMQNNGILGWKRVNPTGWLLLQIIGPPLVAGTALLFLKFIFSNWEPSPDVEKSIDYRGPQFFLAFFGGLSLAIFIAAITSQLRHDIAGALEVFSLFLSVPALMAWVG